MPFENEAGEVVTGDEPLVLLRQVSPAFFRLEESFHYVARDATIYSVNKADLTRTDLASVPRSVRWFASPYGRHTLAALLHDRYVRKPNPHNLTRRAADNLFLEAMDELGVGWLRRSVMWSAVTAVTRLTYGWLAIAGVGLWLALAALGSAGLVWSAIGWISADVAPPGWVWKAALLLPWPAVVLWGRDWKQGFIAIWGVLLIVPTSVLAWLVERLFSIGEVQERTFDIRHVVDK